MGESKSRERKGNKLFIDVHHRGNWNSVLLGPSETSSGPCLRISCPRTEKLGPTCIFCGLRVAPTRVLSPSSTTLLGCSCLYLRSSSSKRESFQGKLSQREERWGNWRLEALNMLETVHCSCQWTWAWRHIVTLLVHVQKLHLFLYLKDLQLGYKLFEGKNCVSLAFWGVTKIKDSALHIVSAELIFVERMSKF